MSAVIKNTQQPVDQKRYRDNWDRIFSPRSSMDEQGTSNAKDTGSSPAAEAKDNEEHFACGCDECDTVNA